MTLPTPEQTADIAATGHAPTTIGAHSVGVPTAAKGLPIVGWSSVGGDLRIPHFIGLHAMQIVPLFGVLLASQRGRGKRRSTGEQVGLVWLAGVVLSWSDGSDAMAGAPRPTIAATGHDDNRCGRGAGRRDRGRHWRLILSGRSPLRSR